MQFNNFYFATDLIGLKPPRSHTSRATFVYRKTNWWFDDCYGEQCDAQLCSKEVAPHYIFHFLKRNAALAIKTCTPDISQCS
jgi:hypothetical protein